MQAIDLHLFLKYHFPTVAFDTFCKCKSFWSWFPFCTDGLLKIYNHHRIPLKVYCRVTSILQITLSLTYLYLWRVHRVYPCTCYPSTWVPENGFRKTNDSAWNNFSNLWRQLQQDFETKFEWRTFCKNEHQNRNPIYQYTLIANYSLFGELQIVEPNLAKRKNDNNFKK